MYLLCQLAKTNSVQVHSILDIRIPLLNSLVSAYLVLNLFWRWTGWLQHALHNSEPNAGLRLIFGDGEKAELVVVAEIAGQRVPVLVRQPFIFCGVRMSSTNIFTLQMFQLTVDVVPVAHFISSIHKYLKHLLIFWCSAND